MKRLYEIIYIMSNRDERLVLLGSKLKQLRKSRHISQLNLSMKIGITREHLSKIERGATYPSVKVLFDITSVLKYKLEDLFNI